LEVAGKEFWSNPQDPVLRTAKYFDESTSKDAQDAVAAIQSIGTNALPWLLKWAADDNREIGNRFLNIFEKSPRFLRCNRIGWTIIQTSARKRSAAIVGFAILGRKAAPAVPDLVTLVQKSKSQTRILTGLYCLGVLGDAARPALPCLQRIATSNPRTWVAARANMAIWRILGADPQQIGPIRSKDF
jgi:hypothetical protein